MTPRGIIFDKDGTLFDFRATWGAWAGDLLTGLVGPRAAELGRVLGFDMQALDFERNSPIIAETTDHLVTLMLPHLPDWDHAGLKHHMKSLAAAAPLAPAHPDLAGFLAGLRGRGLRLGVVTNDDEASAMAQLQRAGIAQAFDFIAGYDSGHGAKPAPDPLLAFARATDLDPAGVLMVGDSRHDLIAGQAAGMRTIGVLTGPALAADLAPLADVVLADIGHIPAWLDKGWRGQE